MREASLVAASCAVSIGIMGAVAHVAAEPFVFPSLGPTAFLLFYKPEASASSPRNTIGGHVIGAVCGLLSLAVLGLLDEPSALEAGVTWSRAAAAALAMGATSGLMIALRLEHPPAGATTLIVALGLMKRVDELLVLVLAVCLLVLQAWITNRYTARRSRDTPRPTSEGGRST